MAHFGPFRQPIAVSSQFLQALQIATNYEYGSLTPLLRTFAWPSNPYDQGELVASFTSLFIGDRVESLVFNESLESQAPKVLSGASIYLHTKRLRLKSLEAASTSGPGKTEGVVLPYLLSQAWDHLKSLTLDWCRPELMDHLASLPRLQTWLSRSLELISLLLWPKASLPSAHRHFSFSVYCLCSFSSRGGLSTTF